MQVAAAGTRGDQPRGSALAKGRGLAHAIAQEVELRAPGDPVADDLDLLDPRAVDLERALHTDPGGDPPNRDRAGDPAATEAHDGAFEDLDALAGALDDLGRHLDGIAGREFRKIRSKLVLDDLVKHVHAVVPDSTGQPTLRGGRWAGRGGSAGGGVYHEVGEGQVGSGASASRSGRRCRVRSMACPRRQRSTAP